MERFLLYLDDLDDLYGAAGLMAERLRRLAWNFARILVALSVAASGVLAALQEPPLGIPGRYSTPVCIARPSRDRLNELPAQP